MSSGGFVVVDEEAAGNSTIGKDLDDRSQGPYNAGEVFENLEGV